MHSIHTQRPVLFCFDGSDSSQQALAAAGALLRPGDAVILTVWQTMATQLLASGGFAEWGYLPDEGDLDAQEQAAAVAAAEAGATLARRHGWQAQARVVNSQSTIWQTVIEVADELDAALIVLGARGRNAAKRALLGSVVESVLHHSHRLALIAPELRTGPKR